MIQFLLNRQVQTIEQLAPALSVLEYLRISLGRTGTKEGCAAGDCGACTVVIAELNGEQLHYQAVNACITPVASLHGKQLITVEDLSEQNHLHPVQQSMVDCHGSQCGFCTPGIVMSLFAWWQGVKAGQLSATRETIEQALSGNLCRCTGYQPILNAAWASLEAEASDQFQTQEPETIRQLKSIAEHSCSDTTSDSITSGFLSPRSIEALFQYRTRFPDAPLVAGATDLGLNFTQQLQSPSTLIYTGNIAEMKRIEQNDKTLVIGAAVTYRDMHATLKNLYPAFADMLNRLGSLQVRNQGTLGGNIANASPIGDTPPVVLALDGHIHLQSAQAKRNVKANDFFTAYRQTAMQKDECIVAIELPLLKDDEVLKVYKISKRFDDDISTVCLAVWIKWDTPVSAAKTVNNIRIACGGMAAVPARARQTEKVLVGKAFDETSISLAQKTLSKDFAPIDDVRASAAYRMAVVAKLLLRAYYELNSHDQHKPVVNLFDPQLGLAHV